jgi:hypothetical protein
MKRANKLINLSVILIFNFSTLMAQQKNNVGFKDFYLSLNTNFTHILLTKDMFDIPFPEVKASFNAVLGKGIGVGSEYYMNERWAFRAGFNYTNLKYNRVTTGWQFGADLDTLTFTVKSSRIVSYNNLHYVDIPITLIRYFNKKRTTYLGFGTGMNVLVQSKQKNKAFYGNGSTEDLRFIKNNDVVLANYQIELIGGYKIPFNSAQSLIIQPFLNLRLKNSTVDDFNSKGIFMSSGASFLFNFSSLKKKKTAMN